MKYLIITSIILSSLFLFSSRTYSQSATTMQDILETVSAKVIELEDQRNQEIVNMTFDLIVNTGKKTVWRYLDPAFDYDVMVLGDRRVEKLKITVYKKNSNTNEWEFVDEYTDDKPVIRLDPQEFEQYEFTVSIDKFKTGSTTGHFALILYHQNPERGK